MTLGAPMQTKLMETVELNLKMSTILLSQLAVAVYIHADTIFKKCTTESLPACL